MAALATMYDFVYSDIMKHINIKHPNTELINMVVPENYNDLENAYRLYKVSKNKPSMECLVKYCSIFLQPIYIGYKGELVWDTQTTRWIKH